MGTVYRIHPAIGVARLGNHESAFFVGPETPGSPGVDIGPEGTETPMTDYKADGKVKRQGARFRVVQYEQDADGRLTVTGEVPDAHIEWSVDLCNRKAALRHQSGSAGPRNTRAADPGALVIRPAAPVRISGPWQGSVSVDGSFMGTGVHLGDLRTDGAGRLIVLGGHGVSGSVPPGAAPALPANNGNWFDDVSDGPITAVVTRPGEQPIAVHDPAWVVVAPPDFAPAITASVSLYDVAFQCAVDKRMLAPAPVPSFSQHIRPLVERTVDLAWVDDWTVWGGQLPVDWAKLADTGPGAKPDRQAMADRIRNPGLSLFHIPAYLEEYLTQWVDGHSTSDLDAPPPAEPLPAQLDRAALDVCTGANFLPGIEAGRNMQDADLYGQPFRLDPSHAAKVYPGCLTEIMALPWQSDFYACQGTWWPSQRPDQVMTDGRNVPGSKVDWAAPIAGAADMLSHVMQLGFILAQQVDGRTVFVEVGRDPAFPRT